MVQRTLIEIGNIIVFVMWLNTFVTIFYLGDTFDNFQYYDNALFFILNSV